jgi:hypothetical protein
MRTTSTNQDHYECLRQAIHFDTQKRFEILREEIEHLISAIAFRTRGPDAHPSKTSSHGSAKAPTSQAALLMRIETAGTELKKECAAETEEMRAFDLRWSEDRRQAEANPDRSDREEELAALHRFAILWNAKQHEKAVVIAERLGDLHDRLEQFLQRTNPDHPDPTLRRRAEQGLTDKYLCEFARWIHRDLAMFAKSSGAAYPYEEVPSTFQSWAYDRSSSQHAFMTLDAHVEWKRFAEGRTSSPSKPSKFTAISLSYWIPERPSLIPIVGHELAHQVLRDLYGREVNFPSLESDESEVARLFRRLTHAVETWLLPRYTALGGNVKDASYVVREIACDVLAAVRFGYAYAYSWVLEMISDQRLAQLFHDEYGMLRRYSVPSAPGTHAGRGELQAEGHDSSTLTDDFWRLQKDASINAKRLQRGILNTYYRGVVLAKLLDRLDLETDSFATSFQRAFEVLLQHLLRIYVGPDNSRYAYESEMARDLADNVVTEWVADDRDDEEEGFGDSSFLKAVREFWASPKGRYGVRHFSLSRQLLNHSYRTMVERTIREGCQPITGEEGLVELPDLTSPRSVRTLTDLTWRLEWLIESEKLRIRGRTKAEEQLDKLRNKVRAVNLLGMDDYLVRTANPIRLFSVCVDKQDAEGIRALHELAARTNSISSRDLQSIYGDGPIEDLSDIVESRKEPLVYVDGKPVRLDSLAFQWLVTPLKDQDVWQNLAGRDGAGLGDQYMLDLMRVKAADGALGKDMRVHQPKSEVGYSKYSALCSAALLGRYDAVVLHHQSHRDGALGWDFSLRTQDGWKSIAANAVSRSKRLVRVCRPGTSPMDMNSFPLMAVILISLKWDASRLLVARWLTSQRLVESNGTAQVATFLSDGWEDLVLLVGVDEDDTGMKQTAGARETIALIEELNRNPFVSSTETLFTRRLVDHHPSEFRFRFAFRVGDAGYSVAKSALVAICRSHQLEVQEVAGNKDFEVVLPQEANVSALHGQFHEGAAGSYRVETRVAWTLAS